MKMKKLVTILLFLGCLITFAGTSSANVISFSDNVNFDHDQIVDVYFYDCHPSLDYTFLSDSVSLSQFDPVLGILKSVELVVESSIEVDTYYWYRWDTATTSQHWYSDVVGSVNGLEATFSQDHNYWTKGEGYYNHVFDIAGTASDSALSDPAAFIGTGTVDVAITGDDRLCCWWNPYHHYDTDTYGTVSATLNYNYEVRRILIDIKPGSCPNPFNSKSRGVIPVAILGTEEFDVTTIDPETVKITFEDMEGVAPIRWAYEDVGTPFEGELCDCHDLDGDGYMDLILKFDNREVEESLVLSDFVSDYVPLTISCDLLEEFDGLHFEGIDCMKILK